jgi:hypothetical protein
MPKKGSFENKSTLTILLSSLGLHLSSLLVNCVEDVACKSSHNNSYKKNERFNLYMFNVIYMWHVPCVISTLNKIFSVCLNLMLLPPYLAQHKFLNLWKLVLEDLLEDMLEFSFYHNFFVNFIFNLFFIISLLTLN